MHNFAYLSHFAYLLQFAWLAWVLSALLSRLISKAPLSTLLFLSLVVLGIVVLEMNGHDHLLPAFLKLATMLAHSRSLISRRPPRPLHFIGRIKGKLQMKRGNRDRNKQS